MFRDAILEGSSINTVHEQLQHASSVCFEIDLSDLTGDALLHYASVRGQYSILKELMDAGADANVKDPMGRLRLRRHSSSEETVGEGRPSI